MEVNDVERNYLPVIKTCGTVAGIWPYNSKRSKWIGRIITLSLTFTGMMSQIAYVLRHFSVDIIIEQCPFFTVGALLFVKEVNYIVHEEKLKSVLESIFNDWLINRPKAEMDILDKYAKRGLFFNYMYVANGLFCYVIFTAVAVSPRVMDLVSPKNESRGVGFIYPAYYGLDEEEHYYILFGHMLIVITVVFFVYVACDSFYMNIVQHACGLLNVSGNRFKFAVNANLSDEKEYAMIKDEVYQREYNSVKLHQYAMEHHANWSSREKYEIREKEHEMTLEETYRRVRHSIQAHQHATKYIMQIEELHATYLFILVALTMLSFSVTLVKASMMDPCVEFYKYCGFVVVQLVHLLFLSIQGHFVIVAHDKTFNSICSSVWYNAVPKTQALYMLPLRKNLTPPLLTAGGLISLNLETFAEILKASVSWMTVMKST